jgi:hypothetical protein
VQHLILFAHLIVQCPSIISFSLHSHDDFIVNVMLLLADVQLLLFEHILIPPMLMTIKIHDDQLIDS